MMLSNYFRRILLFAIFFLILGWFPNTILLAQYAPGKRWDKTFGGQGNHSRYHTTLHLQQTADGGYILGGTSSDDIGGDKSQVSMGMEDYWIVKLNASGNKQWDKAIGGSSWERLTSIQQTTDGGYILGGLSSSGIGGDKTEPLRGFGGYDYWVVKLNTNGIKVWDKTLGGGDWDELTSVQQTSDGGYIVGGHSYSGIGGDKTQASRGLFDYWVVKLDASGAKLWDKTFGGNDIDNLSSIQQTADGGYILGGSSFSSLSGDRSQASKGNGDYWVIKVDTVGNKIWDKSFGGNYHDILNSLHQTSDGGYILGGYSGSDISSDKTQASKGGNDFWVVKLDATGNITWDKTIGGSDNDELHSLMLTSDGGYVMGGRGFSGISGDKTQACRGFYDYWVVMLDASGNLLWDKTLGGDATDDLTSLQQTTDGGFIIGGQSTSKVNGDKTVANKGYDDFWVVKLGPDYICRNKKPALSLINPDKGKTYEVTDTLLVSDKRNNCFTFNFTDPNADQKLTVTIAPDNFNLPVVLNDFTGYINKAGQVLTGQICLPGCDIQPNLIYKAKLIVTDNGCAVASDTLHITMKGIASSESENKFLMPNIFTPNSDGLNDTFTLPTFTTADCNGSREGSFESVKVFNRWGVQVFQSTDRNFGWDGKNVSNGTYFYLISYQKKKYKGFVEIVR